MTEGLDRIDSLAVAVALAAEKVDADRLAQEERLKAADRKALWGRRAAYTAVILAVPALILGLVVKSALDELQAQRAERTLISCGDRLDIRIGMNAIVLDSYGFDGDTGLVSTRFAQATPEQQTRVREFLSRRLLELPICDGDEINAFYASNRQAGVVPIDGTGDDYSEAVTPP